MIESIKKLAELNKSVVDLIKEEKMEEAVVKLAEVQTLTEAMQKEAEKPADVPSEEIAKAEKVEKESIAKAVETIEKWASLNISAESVKTLMEDFQSLKSTVTKCEDRLTTVEETKGISKQANELTPDPANVWAQ